jgi:hypothetical protein
VASATGAVFASVVAGGVADVASEGEACSTLAAAGLVTVSLVGSATARFGAGSPGTTAVAADLEDRARSTSACSTLEVAAFTSTPAARRRSTSSWFVRPLSFAMS